MRWHRRGTVETVTYHRGAGTRVSAGKRQKRALCDRRKGEITTLQGTAGQPHEDLRSSSPATSRGAAAEAVIIVDEFVTPAEAVSRLAKIHYRGAPKSLSPLRMALVGALRQGQIEWRCARWREQYISDKNAMYDENGGVTSEEPKYGFPASFWNARLASDTTAWKSNFFISQGEVTRSSAPYKVRLWLSRNDEAFAVWSRSADDVSLLWTDVVAVLGSAGWQSWKVEAHEDRQRQRLRSWHYREAVIDLLRIAIQEPGAEWDKASIYDRLFDAFDSLGRVPDDAELSRLTSSIHNAIQADDDDFAPP